MQFASDFVAFPPGFPTSVIDSLVEAFGKGEPGMCVVLYDKTKSDVYCCELIPILFYGLLLILISNAVGQLWKK